MKSERLQFSLRTLIIAVLFLSVLLGFVVYFRSYMARISAEYNTLPVIETTIKHIQANAWPKDWESLAISQSIQSQVRMRFDVTLQEIHTHPELVQTVIVPSHGAFRFYPHADDLKKRLLEAVEQAVKENP